MPLLVYSNPDFVPNTLIKSADVNAKYNDIKTLLNVTGLDDVNIQTHGITRGTKLKLGTPNGAVYNDGTGAMTDAAALPPLSGGTGLSLTLTSANAGQVPQVNAAGTAFQLASPPDSAGTKLYIYNSFL